jgi:hypothetical protein
MSIDVVLVYDYGIRVLVGKPERKRPLGRPRNRWEHIRLDRRGIGCEGVDWIYLAQDRDKELALVNKIINLRVP